MLARVAVQFFRVPFFKVPSVTMAVAAGVVGIVRELACEAEMKLDTRDPVATADASREDDNAVDGRGAPLSNVDEELGPLVATREEGGVVDAAPWTQISGSSKLCVAASRSKGRQRTRPSEGAFGNMTIRQSSADVEFSGSEEAPGSSRPWRSFPERPEHYRGRLRRPGRQKGCEATRVREEHGQ